MVNILGTIYSHCNCASGFAECSLTEWMARIRSNEFEKPVLEYRKLKAEGRDAEAQMIKKQLTCFLCQAVALRSRHESEVQSFSEVAMADYDCHDPEWTHAQGPKLQQEKFVLAYHESVGGGLRVYFRLLAPQKGHYKEELVQALERLDEVVGFEHDPKATDRLRLSYASYDPEAWIRPNLEDSEPFQVVRQSLEEKRYLDFVRQCFDSKHPCTKGNRNDSFLYLGMRIKNAGYSPQQLDRFIELVARDYSDEEYQWTDIEQRLRSGYNYAQVDNYSPALSAKTAKTAKATKAVGVQKETEGEEHASSWKSDREIIAENCPTFPDAAIEHLPPSIKKVLKRAHTPRERDMLLSACLAVISVVTPNQTVRFRRANYSLNLAVLCLAPSGSGKSIISYPMRFLYKLNQRFVLMNKEEAKRYKMSKIAWDNEVQAAREEKREPDKRLIPEEPKGVLTLICPDSISRSQLIHSLAQNFPGMIIFSNEIDVLTGAIKSDVGGFGADLRKIFVNEAVSSYYRVDGMPIVAPFPKLSFLGSGTLDQIGRMLDSEVDGMLSRLLPYLSEGEIVWYSLVDDEEGEGADFDWDVLADQYADKVMEMYDFLEAHPSTFRATHNQLCRFDKLYGRDIERLKEIDQSNMSGLFFRGCMLNYRIAAVLAVLRKFREQLTDEVIYFTDEEVDVAIQLMHVYVQHTFQTNSLLPHKHKVSLKENNLHIQREIFNNLPDEFTTEEFTEVCRRIAGYGHTKIRTLLNEWQADGLIECVRRGHYRKTGKPY